MAPWRVLGIDKKTIAEYLKEAVKQEPEMMIDLLVDKVYPRRPYRPDTELYRHAAETKTKNRR